MGGTQQLDYRADIDGLRAVAVLFVLVYHTLPHALRGGFIGVDVFFVISGYLITQILLREAEGKHFSILNFYIRRIRRIFPALILVLLATGIYGWYVLLPSEFVALSRHVLAASGFVSNLLLWHESGYFDQAAELKPLLHMWSLGVEEQFYLVWPLVLAWAARRPGARLTAILVALGVGSFAYSLYQLQADSVGAFYSPVSRFWELLTGAALAYALSRYALPRTEVKGASVLGLFLIVLSGIGLNASSAFPGGWALLPVGGAALIIYAGRGAVVNRYVLAHPTMVWIGRISYPLYLWHWVVLAFIRIQSAHPNWPLRVTGALASVALAAATFHVFEKPLRLKQGRRIVTLLLAGMVVILVASFGVIQFNWFVKPVSRLQQQLQTPYSTETAYRYKTCFLDPKTQGPADFAASCMAAPSNTQRRVLLWGDSLAAQLYPGLQQLSQRGGFVAEQRTAGSCPPALPEDPSGNGSCDAINAATRTYIAQTQPDTVVINGRWLNGRQPFEDRIRGLVGYLQHSGVKNVILVGPAPDWWPDLKKILILGRYTEDTLPQRLQPPPAAWPGVRDTDQRLQSVAQELGLAYLSPVQVLCEGDLCLVRVSNSLPEGLIASDHDHFTQDASEFLFRQTAVGDLFLK